MAKGPRLQELSYNTEFDRVRCLSVATPELQKYAFDLQCQVKLTQAACQNGNIFLQYFCVFKINQNSKIITTETWTPCCPRPSQRGGIAAMLGLEPLAFIIIVVVVVTELP